MELYHHTKAQNLFLILNKDGLNFRGTFFEEFSVKDYKWIKEKASSAIHNLVKAKELEYTSDSSFRPIIFCFGDESDSDYMWKTYADDYKGVQLVVDASRIKSVAVSNGDYFDSCKYIQDVAEIEPFLKDYYHNYAEDVTDDYLYDLEAISALIKDVDFIEEKEYRYIHSYPIVLAANYNPRTGEPDFFVPVPTREDSERYRLFPKDTLLGVRIGPDSSLSEDFIRGYLESSGYDTSKVVVEKLTGKFFQQCTK